MIVISNKKIVDLDFSFWLNNQLTMEDVDYIMETSNLSEEQKKL
ncbi:hypothetical protein ACO2FG_12000 [Staphylococcus epidermidis]